MDKLELFLTPLSSETSSPSPATSVSQPPKDSNAQSLRGRWQFVCCLMNDVDEVSSNFLLSPNTLEWAFREEYLDIIEYDFGMTAKGNRYPYTVKGDTIDINGDTCQFSIEGDVLKIIHYEGAFSVYLTNNFGANSTFVFKRIPPSY